MATYEYSAESGWDTRSYSWGTAKTKAWIGANRTINDTSVRVHMYGAVRCDSYYNIADYGVHTQVGHGGGTGAFDAVNVLHNLSIRWGFDDAETYWSGIENGDVLKRNTIYIQIN